jgi:hypothetical protein
MIGELRVAFVPCLALGGCAILQVRDARDVTLIFSLPHDALRRSEKPTGNIFGLDPSPRSANEYESNLRSCVLSLRRKCVASTNQI